MAISRPWGWWRSKLGHWAVLMCERTIKCLQFRSWSSHTWHLSILLVRCLQRKRTNRIHDNCKEIYSEELAHVSIVVLAWIQRPEEQRTDGVSLSLGPKEERTDISARRHQAERVLACSVLPSIQAFSGWHETHSSLGRGRQITQFIEQILISSRNILKHTQI